MIVFISTHRHTKADKYLVELQSQVKKATKHDPLYSDFSIVRDVMYHYSKKAQDRFFSHPVEAYLFIAFAQSQSGQDFILTKHDGNPENLKIIRLQ